MISKCWALLPWSRVAEFLKECTNYGLHDIRPICDRMISVHFQGKSFIITVIQVYALTDNAEEAEIEQFYEDQQDFLELIPPKRCPFHYRGLECKSRKSRNTWSNRQIWPWNTEWSRTKANRVLPREHSGHSKHPLSTLT